MISYNGWKLELTNTNATDMTWKYRILFYFVRNIQQAIFIQNYTE
jgi:hypothetical protein